MRVLLLPIVLLLCGAALIQAYEDNTLEDDDFAEFEQFDADDEVPAAGTYYYLLISSSSVELCHSQAAVYGAYHLGCLTHRK